MSTPEKLRALAKKFSAGWHEGIQIDATDIADLCEAAEENERMRLALEWISENGPDDAYELRTKAREALGK
mgnify:CR=1 FL=1